MSGRDRFMVVGAVGAGKSSLLSALKGLREEAVKTQAVTYGTHGVDTPGEYLENPRSYRYIISLAQEVQCVLMLHDGADGMHHYPPGFVSSIAAQVVGVISKADHPDSDPERATRILRHAGVAGPVFTTSSKTGAGLEDLTRYLKSKLNMPDFEHYQEENR